MLKFLKTRWQQWRESRFLRKHHCETWQQYNRRYDPDTMSYADRVQDYYCGYPHVHCFTAANHHAYRMLWDYGPGGYRYGYHDMIDWCEENCEQKFRFDHLRVIQNYFGQWEINEIGGGDYVFAAFKSREDLVLFLLRWG